MNLLPRNIGIVLAILGIVLIIYGWNVNTGVYTDYGEEVYNLSLGHEQDLDVILGGFLFIGGIFLFATGHKQSNLKIFDDIAEGSVASEKNKALFPKFARDSYKKVSANLFTLKAELIALALFIVSSILDLGALSFLAFLFLVVNGLYLLLRVILKTSKKRYMPHQD